MINLWRDRFDCRPFEDNKEYQNNTIFLDEIQVPQQRIQGELDLFYGMKKQNEDVLMW